MSVTPVEPSPPEPAGPARPRVKVARPPRVVIEQAAAPPRPSSRSHGYREHAGRLPGPAPMTISYRPRSTMGMVFAVVAVAWNGGLIAMLSSLGRGHYLLVLHALAGIVLAVVAAEMLARSMRITVTSELLDARVRALGRDVDRTIVRVAEVRQLYCEKERVVRMYASINEPHSTSYKPIHADIHHLSALLHDGRRVRLLANIEQARVALFLEQTIEEHLGIADASVAGESNAWLSA